MCVDQSLIPVCVNRVGLAHVRVRPLTAFTTTTVVKAVIKSRGKMGKWWWWWWCPRMLHHHSQLKIPVLPSLTFFPLLIFPETSIFQLHHSFIKLHSFFLQLQEQHIILFLRLCHLIDNSLQRSLKLVFFSAPFPFVGCFCNISSLFLLSLWLFLSITFFFSQFCFTFIFSKASLTHPSLV